MFAECAWKGCLPVKIIQHRSPMALLHALKDAGHVGHVGFESTKEIIEICNKCAHCIPVEAYELTGSIAIWHTVDR